MCTAVLYVYRGQDMRFYFQNAKATLPVKSKNNDVLLIPWGRRIEQHGVLPKGATVALDTIYAGRWDRWFPRPVKLPITQFMQLDIEGGTHWFDIPKGKWIQGLIAREKHEQRVYIVTIEPVENDAIYASWPRILTG